MRRLAALVGAAFTVACSGSDAPVNGSIVASHEGRGLHLVDPAEGSRRLIPGTRRGFEPAWSHDGSRIAFTRAREVRSPEWEWVASDLYVVRPGGAEERLVVRNASKPSWSPDSSEIVFMRDVCGAQACALDADLNPYELFVVELETGDVRRLTSNRYYDGDPAWSPDGDWIAFASERGLSVVRPDGSDGRTLTRKWDDSAPAWSPDGEQLAFSDYTDLYVLAVDGGRPQRLTENEGPDYFPAWSPDGTKIAYLGNHVCARRSGCTAHEPMRLRVMNADGSGSRALTDDGWGRPSWSPQRDED